MAEDYGKYNQFIAREAVRRLGEYYAWPANFYTGSDVLFHLIGTPIFQQAEDFIGPIQNNLVYTKALPTIAAVSYNLEEQVYPLFDYSQFYPVRFVRGSWMVTGTMAIYYSERDLLFKQIQDFLFPNSDELQTTDLPDYSTLSNSQKADLLDELISISVDLENINNTAQHTRVVRMIRGLKQSVWAPGNEYISNVGTIPWKDDAYQPRFTEPEFNLLITHGPLGIHTESIPGITPTADILNDNEITGQASILDLTAVIDRQRKTNRVLYGCQILSHATRYNNDGQPIMDEYEFVAKDEMSLDGAFSRMIAQGDTFTSEGLDQLEGNLRLPPR